MDYLRELSRGLYRLVSNARVSAQDPVATVQPVATEPTAASYRIAPGDIDHTKCVGRILAGGEDRRWKPIIYRESQCRKTVYDGGLCKRCADTRDRCEGKEEEELTRSERNAWRGRITEEPRPWSQMLGTAWAESKHPTFIDVVHTE